MMDDKDTSFDSDILHKGEPSKESETAKASKVGTATRMTVTEGGIVFFAAKVQDYLSLGPGFPGDWAAYVMVFPNDVLSEPDANRPFTEIKAAFTEVTLTLGEKLLKPIAEALFPECRDTGLPYRD